MMYEKLHDHLRKDVGMSNWYEKDSEVAQEILGKFEDMDWHELAENICHQSIDYQKKLVYCIEKLRYLT